MSRVMVEQGHRPRPLRRFQCGAASGAQPGKLSHVFDIPPAARRGGELTLLWPIPPGLGGFDGSVGIAEVFLIRN
jgi:hypothetical protein